MKRYAIIIGVVLLVASLGFVGCRKNDLLPSSQVEWLPIEGGKVPLSGSYAPEVSAFIISATEVTQAQWKAVMGNEGNHPDHQLSESYGKGDNYPMYYVSWYDAIIFCNKLSVQEGKTPCYTKGGSTNPDEWGDIPRSSQDAEWDAIECDWDANGYRLPTEAEWLLAARGGEDYPYSGSDKVDTVAWYNMNSGKQAHEVGTKKANAFGLYDMSGNILEWCWDWYDGFDEAKLLNPTGADYGSYRLHRGGHYDSVERGCALSDRSYGLPNAMNAHVGFRIVHKPE